MKTSALQQEIRQRRPFATPEQEGILGLLRTADLVRRYLAELVEPRGITLQQYNVLRILRGAAEQGSPTLEIADRMVEQAPGITRLLDRLEAKGLVRRERCPDDRRQVLCFIEKRGLSLLSALDPVLEGADRGALRGLKQNDVIRLTRLLDAVRAGHSSAHVSNVKTKKKENYA